tara:strand:- start:194 stop:331 length:138 start_codon:yes stop_codon:yes gene_type:complete
MDKLYIQTKNITESPKKETLNFIKQFASSYKYLKPDDIQIDFISN